MAQTFMRAAHVEREVKVYLRGFFSGKMREVNERGQAVFLSYKALPAEERAKPAFKVIERGMGELERAYEEKGRVEEEDVERAVDASMALWREYREKGIIITVEELKEVERQVEHGEKVPKVDKEEKRWSYEEVRDYLSFLAGLEIWRSNPYVEDYPSLFRYLTEVIGKRAWEEEYGEALAVAVALLPKEMREGFVKSLGLPLDVEISVLLRASEVGEELEGKLPPGGMEELEGKVREWLKARGGP